MTGLVLDARVNAVLDSSILDFAETSRSSYIEHHEKEGKGRDHDQNDVIRSSERVHDRDLGDPTGVAAFGIALVVLAAPC
jgi:hypothetical protein